MPPEANEDHHALGDLPRDHPPRGRGQENEEHRRGLLAGEVSEYSVGKTPPHIQEDVKIGLGTVKYHLNNIFEKLDVRDRTQAAARAAELGLLPGPTSNPHP